MITNSYLYRGVSMGVQNVLTFSVFSRIPPTAQRIAFTARLLVSHVLQGASSEIKSRNGEAWGMHAGSRSHWFRGRWFSSRSLLEGDTNSKGSAYKLWKVRWASNTSSSVSSFGCLVNVYKFTIPTWSLWNEKQIRLCIFAEEVPLWLKNLLSLNLSQVCFIELDRLWVSEFIWVVCFGCLHGMISFSVLWFNRVSSFTQFWKLIQPFERSNTFGRSDAESLLEPFLLFVVSSFSEIRSRIFSIIFLKALLCSDSLELVKLSFPFLIVDNEMFVRSVTELLLNCLLPTGFVNRLSRLCWEFGSDSHL